MVLTVDHYHGRRHYDMSTAWEKGSDRRWRTFRQAILERDKWTCTIVAMGCTEVAEHVDHIIPLSVGGEKYDPLNCRASCGQCNMGRKKGLVTYEPDHKSTSTW